MADPIKGANNTGAKAFGGVVAIVAVILGVYAMTEPMGQRMDFLRDRMDVHLKLHSSASVLEDLAAIKVKLEQLEKHENMHAHSGAVEDLAAIKEKFIEVETQFRGLREVTDTRFDAHTGGGHPHSVELNLAKLRTELAVLQALVEERTGGE
jgi:hypothetical protein